VDLTDGLRTTGAVRRFAPDPVDDATVAAILDTARFAPSGGNRQPWRVAVVRDAPARTQLAALMQPVWDEYVAASQAGQRPFNAVSYVPPTSTPPAPNELLDGIVDVPVVLVVAADLRELAVMDRDLDRVPIVGGASIYPFCWSVLLAAHAHGLGGVMTTFLSRAEEAAAPLLALPDHHALAATIFLGRPAQDRPTRLTRRDVTSFATVDRFDGEPFPRGGTP
jgi:nitroreductase